MYFVRIYSRLVYLTERGFAVLAMYMSVLVALLRIRRNFVVRRYVGQRSLEGAAKVAVFVHFDSQGKVYDFVVYYLEALRRAGFEIVFTSNSPKLDPDGLARILPLCALVLHRKNIGYDFGAYKDSLAELGDLSRFDEVVLANDSVYGPLFDLKEVLEKCDGSADVWGMTDSQELRYHLQSYFLLFRKVALMHPCVTVFWQSVRPVRSRAWTIQRYEIGLTQALLQGGLRCAALYPYSAVTADDADTTVNVMHHNWEQLIDMGCPFIKRELLLNNPWRIAAVDRWWDSVGAVSVYDIELIGQHLRVTARSAESCRSEMTSDDGGAALPDAGEPDVTVPQLGPAMDASA